VYAHEDKRKAATTIQNWFWHKKTWKRDGQRSYHHLKPVLAQHVQAQVEKKAGPNEYHG
jgi:hypothetical protein